MTIVGVTGGICPQRAVGPPLDIAVLPRTTSLDVSGLGADSRDPFLHGLGDELRSVVGADMTGDTTQDEEVGQNVDHIDGLELAGDTDRQPTCR